MRQLKPLASIAAKAELVDHESNFDRQIHESEGRSLQIVSFMRGWSSSDRPCEGR